MMKLIRKVPAGMFVVPMITSMLLNTFFPDLFNIGGMTQDFFGGSGLNAVIAIITFCSGVTIKVSDLAKLIKRHGVLLLLKLVLAIGLSILYMKLFGQDGVLGISALAFTTVMLSMNPSVYLSIVEIYGDEVDPAAFAITGLFPIPLFAQLTYTLAGYGDGGAGFSLEAFMPIISTLIVLVVGIIVGNIEPEFRDVFGPAVGAIIPILGWGIGQGVNLIEAFKSGLSGVLMTLIYLAIYSLLYLVDTKVLKNDGIAALAMNVIAGTSASAVSALVAQYPELAQYSDNATGIILTGFLITALSMPTIAGKRHEKLYQDQ